MRELEKIEKYVINYSDIPYALIREYSWIKGRPGVYHECYIDMEEKLEGLDKWILEKYPFLIDEESFFIKMDQFKQ